MYILVEHVESSAWKMTLKKGKSYIFPKAKSVFKGFICAWKGGLTVFFNGSEKGRKLL